MLGCLSGVAQTCDDGILCSVDSCDEGVNVSDNLGSCDFDMSGCECQNNGDCDDSNPCTDDVCNAQKECENTNNDLNSCDDGFFCTENDRCSAGLCIGDALDVDDGVDFLLNELHLSEFIKEVDH